MFRKIKKFIRKMMIVILKNFGNFIKVDKKLIVFTSFNGRGYSDSPKYIYEAMCQDHRFDDYTKIWFMNKGVKVDGVTSIRYASMRYFYYIARAKVWIFNCKMPGYLKKKKSQIYVQTWHGTPLKKLGCDIEVKEGQTFYRSQMSGEEMKETYRVDAAKYDYMVSPSDFTSKIFPNAFGVDKEKLLEVGYPRNDCLKHVDEKQVKALKEELGIPMDKKVLLYAPTWRDNNYSIKGFQFELKVNFALWQEILGDEYVILFKPHYLIVTKFDMEAYKGFVYLMDANMDIATLYPLADALVTDYSSVFFDYALLKRPIYFYMYDLENYRDELRGFYIDIDKDLPGDIFEDEKAMLETIKANKFDYERLNEFSKYFNSNEDGMAAKKILDVVYKDLEK